MEEVHITWPQIPEALATPGEDGRYDLSGLTTDQLREFAAAVRKEAKPAFAEGAPSAEFMAEYAPYRVAMNAAKAEVLTRPPTPPPPSSCRTTRRKTRPRRKSKSKSRSSRPSR